MSKRARLCMYLLLLIVAIGLGQVAPEDRDAYPTLEPATPDTTTPQPTTDPDAAASGSTSSTSTPSSTPTASPAATSTAPPPGIAAGGNVAVIRIEGDIYDFTLTSLERRVDKAVNNGATLIVIELDTYGGLATAALDIAKYIKGKIPVPTVAWINNKAYSAGILIASACGEIVMSTSSATGDCAPIIPHYELAPTERAKALSPLLAEFRSNASVNGYPYVLLHATCELGVKVFEVKHKKTGNTRTVNEADYMVMVEGAPVTTSIDGHNLVTKLFGNAKAAPIKPITPEIATAADRGEYELVRQIHDGQTLLTVFEAEAVDIKLAAADGIDKDTDLAKHLGAASVTRINVTWSEWLASWLVWWPIRGVLVVIAFLGLLIESMVPGFGVPGIVGISALVVLLVSPFLIGLAEVWPIVLFFVGVVLLAMELFVTPGFGVLGVCGAICMFAGLVMQVVPLNGIVPAAGMVHRAQTGAFWMMGSFAVIVLGLLVLMRYLGRVPGLSRLVLTDTAGGVITADGKRIITPAGPTSGDEAIGHGDVVVGDVGRTVTQLRPTGRAEFEGELVDVVSLGEWLETNARVKVVEVHGNRIVVDKADDA